MTAGAPDATFNGGGDAIIVELNPTGSALLFSTFLGGSNSEGGADIARDPSGDVYITGSTYSQDFPATVGAFDRIWNGDLQIFWGDAFITKLDIDATGSTPPAPPAVPAHRPGVAVQRLVATTADHVRLERCRERRVVHDPDRRLERVHRAARPRRRA